MIRLYLIDGPECPECGCRDAALLEKGGLLGCGRWHCRNCGQVFYPPPRLEVLPAAPLSMALTPVLAPPIIYQRPHCPKCGSTATRVTRTKQPGASGHRTRYHKCADCGKNFKSTEP